MIKILEIIEKMSLVKIRWPTFMYVYVDLLPYHFMHEKGELLWEMVIRNFL